jgi:hypothetical protein
MQSAAPSRTWEVSAGELVIATREALRPLDVIAAAVFATEVSGHVIYARLARDRDVKIELVPMTTSLTRIVVTASAATVVRDDALAVAILDRIAAVVARGPATVRASGDEVRK